MDPDDVAEELYRLPPEEFVDARDEAVAQARASGERDAAREIAAFRRPTRAAWLTNLLVTTAPDDVEGLLSLAGPLAEAQRSLDGAALRQVSAQRTTLVGALARRATELGRDAGQKVEPGLEREVRGVLESALADDDLAAQVRSGRLVRFERRSGFGFGFGEPGPDDGSGSGGTTFGGRTPHSAAPGAAPTGGDLGSGRAGADGPQARPVDSGAASRRRRVQDGAERRERERQAAEQREREHRERAIAVAEDRLEAARLAAHDAERERDVTRERADAAADHRDDAHRRVEELRAELDRARTEVTAAERALHTAERVATDASRRARRTAADVTRAEQDLDVARAQE